MSDLKRQLKNILNSHLSGEGKHRAVDEILKTIHPLLTAKDAELAEYKLGAATTMSTQQIEIERLRGNDLQAFMDAHAKWADVVFKGQPISGVLNHLKEEVQELIDNHKDPSESADVLGLFTRHWYLIGGTAKSLLDAGYEKLTICKGRKNSKIDENGIIHHIGHKAVLKSKEGGE